MSLFDELRQSESAEVEINHPTKGKVATFTVLSRDSAVMQKAGLESSTKRMAKLQRGGRLKITAEEIQEEALDMLTTATIGWKWAKEYADDPKLEFSSANVRAIYANPGYAFIRKAVDEAMGNDELFFEK